MQPASHLLPESGLQADLILLESNWHFAMGQRVRAAARVETADESAALVALGTEANPSAATLIYGFLARAPIREAAILEQLNPKDGQLREIKGLLLTRESADSVAVVRVTVTAF